MLSSQQAITIRQRHDALRAFLGDRTSYRPEEVTHLAPPTNEELSALEVFELHRDRPEQFTAYVTWRTDPVEAKLITTWTGERVGVRCYAGPWHTNNMGAKWRQLRIQPDFCRWYYTGREYESRQCRQLQAYESGILNMHNLHNHQQVSRQCVRAAALANGNKPRANC